MLKRDKSGAVRFTPLHGQTAAKVLAGRPELAGVDSMIWIDSSGAAFTRSAAVLALRDALYDWVARSRYRIFGRYDACPLPPAESRSRFLS